MTPAAHRLSLRVYYEDTDCAGIVYYANYLRFLERGRTELLRTLGHDQHALLKEGIAFAVRAAAVEFLLPAKLDDQLTVETAVATLGRAQMVFSQHILRGAETLLTASIRIACLDPVRGRPQAMPAEIHRQLTSLLTPPAQAEPK